MHWYNILCRTSKVPFEILHKIFCPYIERCVSYMRVISEDVLDLRACKRFFAKYSQTSNYKDKRETTVHINNDFPTIILFGYVVVLSNELIHWGRVTVN